MVLQLRKITRRSPELPEALRLYESAFPANERWGMERVLDDATGISEMFGFYEAGALAGFAILLNWGDMAHIIYFAVEENMRGRGVGSEALRLIRALKPGRRLLVDIERHRPDADNNAQRRRRKAFYERSGYAEAGVYYSWQGEDYEIMISGGEISRAEYFRFWHDIDENSEIFAG